MSNDLVIRLRHAAKLGGHYEEAADRIEDSEDRVKELDTLNFNLRDKVDGLQIRVKELEERVNGMLYGNHDDEDRIYEFYESKGDKAPESI